MRPALAALCVFGLWGLNACAPSAIPTLVPNYRVVTADPDSTETPTPFQPSFSTDTSTPSETPVPTETQASTFTPTATGTSAPTKAAPVQAPPDSQGRTNYILFATLDFPERSVTVEETIRYYNTSGVPLADLVLSVQPNRYSGCFSLASIEIDSVSTSAYALDGQRLTIELPRPLDPGTAITVSVNYGLALPYKRSDGLFGYDFNQINLTDWYPFVVPYSNGWLLHDPMPFGEHLVYDSSDIEVNLRTGGDVIVAASAPPEQNGEWTRYRLYGARTFALSASNEFRVAESAVGTSSIHSYFFDGYQGAGDGMLNAAVQAVGLFDAKFAPYPYSSLSVVQADINDGQEYDGLVFLSTDFYGQYGGTNRSNLVTIGVHEIAHQWWFGLVGNDQALEPWLDEAMALYSERIFYEFTRASSLLDWWWQFRVDFFEPGGYVDTTIYEGGAFRPYTNAVYLNGAHFMEEFRTRLGDEAYYRFLKDYAAQYSYRRATANDWFGLARQHSNADLTGLIGKYFQNPH